MTDPLPIHGLLAELQHSLKNHNQVLLTAPTGSGKTTVVPLALVQEPWLEGRKILLLEPRRLAARMAARYMAGQLGEEVGRTVGYQVRFEGKVSTATRIEVITGGVLLKRLQKDPELGDTGLIIFDEFHERSLECDLNLALALDIQEGLREDLRLLIMSATLAMEPLKRIMPEAPMLTGHGRSYPVESQYLPPKKEHDSPRPEHIARTVCRGIRAALQENRGDILAFLPGKGEIRRAKEILAPLADHDASLLVAPLHGNLSLADQNKAVRPDSKGRRRIILATTIAETSLTIEGITVVVDCGWKRIPRFDPATGLTRLETVRISRASARQRSGRAGRLGPGICFRLWHQGLTPSLHPFDRPEILDADLAGLLLELALWGVSDPDQLRWPDPPPRTAIQNARSLLRQLDAIDADGRITGLGRNMASLPLHPRLAAMLSRTYGNDLKMACDIAALVAEADILTGKETTADLEERLHFLARFRRQGSRVNGVHAGRCRQVDQVSRQLFQQLAKRKQEKDKPNNHSAGGLLSLAYPERIAGLRPGQRTEYKLTSGQGAALHRHDPLAGKRFLAIAALGGRRGKGIIHLAAELDRNELMELHGHRLRREQRVRLNPDTGAVQAVDLVLIDELEISRTPCPRPEPEKIIQVLLAQIRKQGLELLNWDRDVLELVRRVRLLTGEMAEKKGWPDFSEQGLLDELENWLAPYLDKIQSLAGLQKLALAPILKNRLDWQQQQLLDREAPTHLRVPSGANIRLAYQEEGPPVLPVRIQELFGLDRTPTICSGRVKVLLHLLSPARRPMQITDDLAGFWQNSYHQIKKELAGRYPKHHWPDDPQSATATRGVRRKNRKK